MYRRTGAGHTIKLPARSEQLTATRAASKKPEKEKDYIYDFYRECRDACEQIKKKYEEKYNVILNIKYTFPKEK